MKSLPQYLVPYFISQAISIVFLILAWKNTRLARLLFSILFIGAAGANVYYGLTKPAMYLDYASMALPFYRDFINGWFSHYNHLIIPLLAAGQLLIGVGMLLKEEWVKWACIGAIIFLLSIAPLMVGAAFPFSLTVSWAAWMVLKKDKKSYLWQPLNTNQLQRSSVQTIYFCSILSLIFAMTISAISLVDSKVYHDNVFVKTVWQANDWVTLLLSFAAFIGLFFANWHVKTQLMWAGVLSYLIYNYTFYLFGANFNNLFLVYVSIVSLSLISLIALLTGLPVQHLNVTSKSIRFISGYLTLIALMLVLVEVPPTLAFAFSGHLPEIITKTGHPTSVVYALDLSLIVPACLLASAWLWQQKAWGVVLTAIMLVKGIAYGLVLCAGTLLLANRGIDYDPLFSFYIFLVLGGLAGLVILLKQIRVDYSSIKPDAENLIPRHNIATPHLPAAISR